MKYSQDIFIEIVQSHPSVMNEIAARDAVFRINFDTEKRRQISPWIMQGRSVLQQEEFKLWLSLQAREISEEEAIVKMTELMEQYYKRHYPLK